MGDKPWARRRIGDEELRELVLKAIEDGISKTSFSFHLKSDGIALGEGRLFRMWAECEGPIQNKRGGWF